MNVLNVDDSVLIDNSIVYSEKHIYQPQVSSFKNNDEIRIQIPNQDLITLPHKSHLYIEGKLLKTDGTAYYTPAPATGGSEQFAKFCNNGIAFLFREIRYLLGNVEIDRVKDVGLTTTMKGFLSYNSNEAAGLQNAGWYNVLDAYNLCDKNGKFTVCIPLKALLGFAEDYKRVIMNVSQELILYRSSGDLDAIHMNDGTELQASIEKIQWCVPHISLSDEQRLRFLGLIQKNNFIEVPFRSWDIQTYPTLNQTTSHSWLVKTTSDQENIRYIILAFQTDMKNQTKKSMSDFNHINLRNVKVYLNDQEYPYSDLNLDIPNNKYSSLYELYAQFQENYYGKNNEPYLTPKNFLASAPLVAIDCSHQKESLKGGVTLRVTFETSENVPDKTAAHCLIIEDKVIKYNPLTNQVSYI